VACYNNNTAFWVAVVCFLVEQGVIVLPMFFVALRILVPNVDTLPMHVWMDLWGAEDSNGTPPAAAGQDDPGSKHSTTLPMMKRDTNDDDDSS
jgi:hypothetical protein